MPPNESTIASRPIPHKALLAPDSTFGIDFLQGTIPLVGLDLVSETDAVADCAIDFALTEYTRIGRAMFLTLLVAKVGELVRKFVANVLVDRPRKAHAAWLRQAFQARGNIDAIPVDVAPFDDDVPEIDAGPKFKSPLFCYLDIVLSCGLLHLDGALHRFNHTWELDQRFRHRSS